MTLEYETILAVSLLLVGIGGILGFVGRHRFARLILFITKHMSGVPFLADRFLPTENDNQRIALIFRHFEILTWEPWVKPPTRDMDSAQYTDLLLYEHPWLEPITLKDTTTVRGTIELGNFFGSDIPTILNAEEYSDWSAKSKISYTCRLKEKRGQTRPALVRRSNYTNCYPMEDGNCQVGLRVPSDSEHAILMLDFCCIAPEQWPHNATSRRIDKDGNSSEIPVTSNVKKGVFFVSIEDAHDDDRLVIEWQWPAAKPS